MPIATSEIEFRLSVTTATFGDSLPGVAGASLGKYVSRTKVTSAVIGALFPSATAAEFGANNVDYQCLFVVNRHPSFALSNAVAWLTFQKPGGHTVDIAVDSTPVSSINSATAQAGTVTSKNVAPTLVSAFSLAPTKETAISLGVIGPGQVKAIWFRRSGTFDGVSAASGVIDPPGGPAPNEALLSATGTLSIGRPAVVQLGASGRLVAFGQPHSRPVLLSGDGRLEAFQGRNPRFSGYGSLTLVTKAQLLSATIPVFDSVILRVEGDSPA